MNATMTGLTFEKFAPMRGGYECDGALVLKDGVRVGQIQRKVEFVDVGTVTARYRNKVVGYVSSVWSTEQEIVCRTLAEARAVFTKVG